MESYPQSRNKDQDYHRVLISFPGWAPLCSPYSNTPCTVYSLPMSIESSRVRNMFKVLASLTSTGSLFHLGTTRFKKKFCLTSDLDLKLNASYAGLCLYLSQKLHLLNNGRSIPDKYSLLMNVCNPCSTSRCWFSDWGNQPRLSRFSILLDHYRWLLLYYYYYYYYYYNYYLCPCSCPCPCPFH